ncbi:DoxX family protein [Nocardia alni]|uniref:DoxX family protein n=1 Tax=Nocardia alni TaxID=2815723 RepID=UPI0020B18E49|nr:DoxX family protein [Nocardia alni]
MSAVATTDYPLRERESGGAEQPRWNPLTRTVFRFCVVYSVLFCLTTTQIPFAYSGWFSLSLQGVAISVDRFYEPVLRWVGRTVFDVRVEAIPSGSGDQTIDWVRLFCVLVIAVVAAAVWSVLDRRRTEYRTVAGWFLVFARLCLGGQMLTYGFVKLIPTQMPRPRLSTLIEPYGNFRPMGVLWNQVGSSQPYEILLGLAEVSAGVLLFIPRTALVGAMLSLVDMAQVFVLNMTFDVPVKILSGHLLLLSMVLLAPEARRLCDMLLGRATGPATSPYPFHASSARRIAALVHVLLGIWVAAGLLHAQWLTWHLIGEGRPKPPLYGIWSVTDFTRDGQRLPPLLTDQNRWRRVVVDYPGTFTYQRMDDTLVTVEAKDDPQTHRMVLRTATPQPAPLGILTFQQPAPDKALLTGELEGHQVTISLDRVDPDRLPLRSTGFHWLQDRPNP